MRQKLGGWAWLLGFWGIGTYKRNDEIDIRYEIDGETRGSPTPLRSSLRRPHYLRGATQGRSSRSAERIARVAGERLSV